MKKYLLILLGVIFLGGCLTRTYTIEKPRTNLEVKGNRGYLLGTPTEEVKPNRFGDKRTISVLEIEMGSHPSPAADKPKKEAKPVREPVIVEEEFVEEEILPQENITAEKNYELYTIQKNDTLQKISNKFYGTTKKWKMIYDCNKDVLKSPDKVYPGKTIKIPVLDR